MKKLYTKKGFTLIEMGIVMIILSIVIGTVLSMMKVTYTKDKTITTKHQLVKIKNSIIGYAAIHGKLPSSDTDLDGIGNGSGGIGDIPYIDLQIDSKDRYGMVYQYDVNDSLISSNDANICSILSNITGVTTLPRVENDDGSSSYPIAAIVVSKGKDKVLTGKNDDATRVYEMNSNKYNITTNDDLVIEITANELWGRLCNATAATPVVDGNITIYVNSGKDIPYRISDDNGTTYSGCTTATVGSTITITDTQQVSLWDLDGSCTGHELVRTYSQLQDIDNAGDKNNDNVEAIGKQNTQLDELTDI